MPSSDQLPRFTALLFGLSGGLVDFGARTLSLALLRSHPHSPAEHLRDASLLPSPRHKASCCSASRTRTSASAWSRPSTKPPRNRPKPSPVPWPCWRAWTNNGFPTPGRTSYRNRSAQRLAAPLGRADALIPLAGARPGRPPMAAGRPSPSWASSASTAACWSAPNRVAPGRTQCRAMDHRPGRQRAVVRPSPADWDALGHYRARPLACRRHPGTVPPGRAFRDRSPGRAATLPADLAVRRLKGGKP